MSDIRQAVSMLQEPDKSIGEILIEFYDTMKSLENDIHRGGKQATKIVMTMNDIKDVFAVCECQKEGFIGQRCLNKCPYYKEP